MRRIVVVSIIGIDRFTGGYTGGYGGYFAAKVAHERAMVSGAIPVPVDEDNRRFPCGAEGNRREAEQRQIQGREERVQAF